MKLATRIIKKIIRGYKQFSRIRKSFCACWLPYTRKYPFPKRISILFKLPITTLSGDTIKAVQPLLPIDAVEWLDRFLTKDMKVFEWGSGGSTIFFAKRVDTIISIEYDPVWYNKVSQFLKKNGLLNCHCFLKEPKAFGSPNYISTSKNYGGLNFENYCKVIEEYPDDYFDLILIDGAIRPACVSHAMKKVRPGGFIFYDDSDLIFEPFLPGIELLKNWERKDFHSPRFYTYKCHQASIWRK